MVPVFPPEYLHLWVYTQQTKTTMTQRKTTPKRIPINKLSRRLSNIRAISPWGTLSCVMRTVLLLLLSIPVDEKDDELLLIFVLFVFFSDRVTKLFLYTYVSLIEFHFFVLRWRIFLLLLLLRLYQHRRAAITCHSRSITPVVKQKLTIRCILRFLRPLSRIRTCLF